MEGRGKTVSALLWGGAAEAHLKGPVKTRDHRTKDRARLGLKASCWPSQIPAQLSSGGMSELGAVGVELLTETWSRSQVSRRQNLTL